MRVLAFSDWRTQSIDILNEIILEEKPDAILYAGDDLKRVIPINKDLYSKVKNQFRKINNKKIKEECGYFMKYFKNNHGINNHNIPFLYVNGNDDEIFEYKNNFYIKICSHFNRTSKISSSNDIKKNTLYGQLAVNPSFGFQEVNKDILYYGTKCSYGLKSKVYDIPKQYVDILLVHIPPLGHLDLSFRYGLDHIGSKKILNYINKYQPKMVICGHSHFWGGKVTTISRTTVINISSKDSKGATGNYAIINTKSWSYEIKEYKTLIQIRGAIFKSDNDNMSVYGSDKLIYDHNLLSNKNEEIIEKLEKKKLTRIVNRIKSLNWEKPVIIKKLTFQPKYYTLVDIETGLSYKTGFETYHQKIWLIGFLHKKKIYQFEYPNQKNKIVEFLSKNMVDTLVSWTNFDSSRLKRLSIFKNLKWIDACQRVANCVIWHSYKLHELHKAFFNNHDSEIIDGSIAGIYADHIIDSKNSCEYCPSETKVKKEIKKRNRLDLLQMYELCELTWNYNK